jgi:flavin-dependent dehydrogenase
VARRLSSAGAEGELLIAAQEIEFRLSEEQQAACPVEAEVPELFFSADLRGYGWIFRKGSWLNVGLGRQDKHHLSTHVARFLEFLGEEGRLPPGLPQGFHGHAYLLHDQAPRPLVADRIALVGDAAGLAYPRSGEGIRPAVEAGLLLARALREARSGGELRVQPALERYQRDLLARLGPRERSGPGLTDFFPNGWAGRAVGWLLGNPWFAKHVVVERWFVHAHIPALGLL